MVDSPRIEELRRRVLLDPASIAFAALAEEYRKEGRFVEAIATCQAGLQRHPAYLSARVTLGRSLLELGQFDEAREQLEQVLRAAPENLAAIRGLAEIHRRRGDNPETLEQYHEAAAAAAALEAADEDAAAGEPEAAAEETKPIAPVRTPLPVVTSALPTPEASGAQEFAADATEAGPAAEPPTPGTPEPRVSIFTKAPQIGSDVLERAEARRAEAPAALDIAADIASIFDAPLAAAPRPEPFPMTTPSETSPQAISPPVMSSRAATTVRDLERFLAAILRAKAHAHEHAPAGR
jgi:tetratricopeptide (TPR) repeat protein